jgi:hypothetical protein
MRLNHLFIEDAPILLAQIAINKRKLILREAQVVIDRRRHFNEFPQSGLN